MSTPPLPDRRDVLKAISALGATVGLGGVTSASPGRDPGPKSDELLVGVSDSADDPRATVESHLPGEARVVHANEALRYVAVAFPAASDRARENFAEAVTNRPHVKYAEANATYETRLAPNDPAYGSQYAPAMVNAEAAWETTTGSADVTVAVVDQGVAVDHPDLDDNVGDGRDFVDGDGDPSPDDPSQEYHGTHVAGVVAAETDNDRGVAGISESTVLSARAVDEGGRGSTTDIADAVQWAADAGADVVNLSLGGGGHTETMLNAVSYATDNGTLVVAAAGNDGVGEVSYPAAYDETLAVSALDEDGSFASYSNYGDAVDLCAPGSSVLSTVPEAAGEYANLSGTSMASPVVAGVAGLALARWGLSTADLRRHLKATAADVGLPDARQGSGRVDAGDAVNADPSGGTGDGGDSSGSDGGDGGGSDGDATASTTSEVESALDGYWDADCWTREWAYDDPAQVVVSLDGPSDADFDLYVNEGRAECPSPRSHTHHSRAPDSAETITIDDPDAGTPLYVTVDSYEGDGGYALSITEKR